MAYTVYSTSAKEKPTAQMNTAFSQSGFEKNYPGQEISQVSLDQIKTAINKLSTYIKQVDNCGNCFNVTMCQTSTCQSYTCQVCQSSTCQTCESQCTYADYYSDYYSSGCD